MKTIETSKCIFYIKDIPSLDLVYNDKLNEYLLSLEIIKLIQDELKKKCADRFNGGFERCRVIETEIL